MIKLAEPPQASVREAKAHLSEILDRARQGGITVITSHGQAVARVMPPMASADESVDPDQALAAVVAAGICEEPAATGSMPSRKPLTPKGGFSVIEAVADMRR